MKTRLAALVRKRPATFAAEVFAGGILWMFFGEMVPENVPVFAWIGIAAVGLAVGVFGKWRLSEADDGRDDGAAKRWYSILWRYDMYGNRVPPLFLVILTHVFTIGGSFYTMVSVSRMVQ